MAAAAKSPKPAKVKKPKGPKFAARFVAENGSVIRIRTVSKFRLGGYNVEALFFPQGDAAPGGKGTRAQNELVVSSYHATFPEAQAAAQKECETAKEKGFEPQERSGKRTPVGWDAV